AKKTLESVRRGHKFSPGLLHEDPQRVRLGRSWAAMRALKVPGHGHLMWQLRTVSPERIPSSGEQRHGSEGWRDHTVLGACVEAAGECPQSSPSLCLAASLPFIILTLVNSPYKRGFYCNDDSIRYPYKADTITHGLMAGVTITCTVVIISLGEAYLVYTERLYSKSEFNNYLAALYKVVGTFLFGGAISQSLTDLAKYMIGRLRPNFLAVLVLGSCNLLAAPDRLSFYSGHSSFGMYCMMFLA
ncbi:phospholipid phosphatase 2-like, partial [Antrostomus carolinensis]|uniref:phospholipid phosphatase 2-like n=1 Tax=Antrostomus carolinensis TaxID=279965 RepID=UPI00052893CB